MEIVNVSIDHLTGFDIILLKEQNDNFPTEVICHKYSWAIRIPRKSELQNTQDEMLDLGFSDSFIKVISSAVDKKHSWINLDINSSALSIRYECRCMLDFEDDCHTSQPSHVSALNALKCFNLQNIKNVEIDQEVTLDLIMGILHYCDQREWDSRMLFIEALEYYHYDKYLDRRLSVRNTLSG